YAENFDLLREAGAELVFWSPLRDSELPDVDGLYFGGGYPELHARRLAENAAMRKAVRRFAEAGRPVYAECGGLMYLAETLGDADGVAHPMVGVLPAAVRLEPRRMARSEEHTSELQSRVDLVCRLLLEKKKSRKSG